MKSTMPLSLRPIVAVTFALLTLLSLTLSACGMSSVTEQFTGVKDPVASCLKDSPPKLDGALVVAIAVHQNAPAPAVPKGVAAVIEATLASGHPVSVVPIDGKPATTAVPTEPISTASCNAFRTDLNNSANAVSTAISNARATSNGDNLYQAISVAAEAAGAGGHVVVVDSGLADSGPLDFTKRGMTMTNPKAAARYAAATQPLSSVRDVHFTLLLGYTAAPQEPLSGTERINVAQIWADTLKALGAAKVTITMAPRPDTGPETTFVTVPSPVARATGFTPPVSAPTTSVFHENQIRFAPDSTELVDPKATAEAIDGVSRWLAEDRRNTAVITGTTSSDGTEGGRLELSARRAEAIKRLILRSNASVSSDQLTTKGVGTHFADYIDDRRSDGSLDPAKAAENRTVRITALPNRT